MHNFLALFFLGIIQGLTEFLPVSSSGHLVFFSKLFGVEENLFVSILLHMATLLSILFVFYKDIWHMIRHPLSFETIRLVVATIPTCIIVLILMPAIKMSFSGALLPICFILSAVFLFVSEKRYFQKGITPLDSKSAFWMGVAQGFAVFPGISRSGTTISAGLLCGKNKENVSKFSFLMSIPIVCLSLLMEIYEIVSGKIVVSVDVLPLIISFITAFITGVFAIKLMTKLTKKSNLKWFSAYLLIVAFVSFLII